MRDMLDAPPASAPRVVDVYVDWRRARRPYTLTSPTSARPRGSPRRLAGLRSRRAFSPPLLPTRSAAFPGEARLATIARRHAPRPFPPTPDREYRSRRAPLGGQFRGSPGLGSSFADRPYRRFTPMPARLIFISYASPTPGPDADFFCASGDARLHADVADAHGRRILTAPLRKMRYSPTVGMSFAYQKYTA